MLTLLDVKNFLTGFMGEHLTSMAELFPFVLLTNNSSPKLNFKNIINAIMVAIISCVIAVISGGLSAYITIKVLQVKIEYVEKNVVKVERRMDNFENLLWKINNKDKE